MPRPSFYIHAENISPDDFSHCRLVMEVSADSFSYVILSLPGMSPMVVKYYQLDKHKEKSLHEILQETIYSDDLLVSTPTEIYCVYNLPESTLVPEKFFRPDIAGELNELVYGDLDKGIVVNEKIPWWELYNVYSVPPEIHDIVQKKFPSGKYWHYYSLQLKSHKMFTAKEDAEFIKAIFYADKIIVMVFKKAQLQLVQTFTYLDPKDVAYYLLNCCRQFGLHQEELVLQVSGLIEKKSALHNELLKYFTHVGFENIENTIKITDELRNYPLHYFSSLLKMSICV